MPSFFAEKTTWNMNGPIKLAIILTLWAMLFTLVDAKAMSTGEGTYTVSAILVCMCVYRGGGGGAERLTQIMVTMLKQRVDQTSHHYRLI